MLQPGSSVPGTLGGPETFLSLVTFSGGIAASGANANDFSGGTGTFKTSTGALTLGPGATTASGTWTFTSTTKPQILGPSGTEFRIAAGGSQTLGLENTAAGGQINIGAQGNTSTVSFGTSGTTTTLGGTLTFSANSAITTSAGTGSFDFSNGTGVFKTSTGANTLGGNVTISGANTLTLAGVISNTAAAGNNILTVANDTQKVFIGTHASAYWTTAAAEAIIRSPSDIYCTTANHGFSGDLLTAFSAGSLTVRGSAAAGSVGVITDNTVTLTSGKCLSIRNNTVEKCFVDGNGGITTNAVAALTGTAGSSTIISTTGAWTIRGTAADGASAVNIVLDSGTTFATAGAKLVSIRNNGGANEKIAWDLNGKPIIPTGGGAATVGVSAAMTTGAVTISTTAVTANSIIQVTRATPGGTLGHLDARPANITAGTSFIVTSSSNTETSTIFWRIIN